MVKETCEATITKRLVWLVEPLVVSSHEFSFFYFVLDISQIPQISYLLCSHFFVFHRTLLFSLFILCSFHSLKHRRTVNIHVNRPVKLLSLFVLIDSTRLASML